MHLTTDQAYEHSPRWSHDGKWIGFSAGRDGDDDIYIIPATGGQSKRLTWLDADDQICDWTLDSREVIFSSRRTDRYPDYSMLYSVGIESGTPEPISEANGAEACLSPTDGHILLSRLNSQWWRKRERSSGVSHVWSYDLTSKTYETITDTSAHQTGDDFRRPFSRWPQCDSSGSIYLVTERDGTANIWKRNQNKEWSQITFFKEDGVRFPSVSLNGDLIAFEQGTDIWIIKGDNSPQKLELTCPVDPRDVEPLDLGFSDRADWIAFNPDGREIFLEVRGEVIAGRIVGDDDKAARGRANNLSTSNPARDGEMTVSPGGDTLIVASDRAGSRDLYMVTSDDPDTKELARALKLNWELLVQSPLDDHTPRFSPDGKSIAFMRDKGNLIIFDLEKRQERILLEGWSLLGFQWSPDSKWIAFAREDNEYNSDVFVIPSTGGAEVNISRHPDEDDTPVWSGDGKKLAFRSRRRENNWDIYFVYLRLADEQKSVADLAEEVRAKQAAKPEKNGEKDDKKKEKGKKEEEDKKAKTEVAIDTTDIYRRVHTVTRLPGEEGIFAVSPDGEQFAFTSNHEGETDIYKIKWNGEGLKRLTNGSASPKYIDFEPSGKRVRYLDGGGRVKSIDADGGSGKDHPFDCRISVDPRAERKQKFLEIWRRLNSEFYDPDFHGQNWRALRDKYSVWADAASCEEDFGDVVNMMFGELNSSHMGYSSPDGGRKMTGRLGLDFDFAQDGEGFVVNNVVKGGPCDREATKVLVGDRLISVDGVKLSPQVSLEKLLDDQVNQRIELIVLRGKDQKRIIVRPINRYELSDLRYDEWIEARRKTVDSLSNGRLGYLHIKGMGEESLARFEAELYSVGAGKDALVVDVRNNGGGWTTDWLLAMLQVRRHAVTFPRDGGPGYPQSRLPLYAWTKPIITLCNEHSFSNAEIFSHAVKTLGRSKLVGVPTPGGVISTGGDGLLDGSGYRIPLRGWYIGNGNMPNAELNMEGHGAEPDLIVTLQPDQTTAEEDYQLRAAVQEILKETSEGRKK